MENLGEYTDPYEPEKISIGKAKGIIDNYFFATSHKTKRTLDVYGRLSLEINQRIFRYKRLP